MRKRDLTGQTFGKLYVIRQAPDYVSPNGHRKSMWECQCECGKQCVIMGSHLTTGHSVSCGCQHATTSKKRQPKDLTGQRFGMLTVQYRSPNRQVGKNSRVVWHCVCDCGKETDVIALLLTGGQTKSCGCNSVSHAERTMRDYLTTKDFTFVEQYYPKHLKGINGGALRFDFALFNNSRLQFLIELDGEQHYAPVKYFGGAKKYEKVKANDILKNMWAKEHNIPLIRIDVSHCYRDSDFCKRYDAVLSAYHILN